MGVKASALPPAYAEGQQVYDFSVDLAGALRMTGGGGGSSNQGTPNTVANAWPTKVTDGVDVLLVNGDGSIDVGVLDRDARLLGRVKLLDSGGAVIDPALKGQLPASLGQKVMASSLAVVMASDQPAFPVTDAAGSLTVDAPVGTPVFVRLSDGAAALIGQKLMAASVPVVIASDQTNLPIGAIAGAITPGTAAGNLGKAEDAAAVSADTGVALLGLRRDQPALPTAAETSADGDYTWPVYDDHGVAWVRKRQLVSYIACYRLVDATAGQLDLTFTFAANTNKQIATIYHAASATKTVKIRKISVFCTTMTAAVVGFEVRALSAATAPATGNPAITPGKRAQVDAAAEATCLALPTTAGSLVAADSPSSAHVSVNAGATTASVSPSTFGTEEIVLYEYKDGSEQKPLTMRAGVAEGYAVNARSTAATAQRFTVLVEFTEE